MATEQRSLIWQRFGLGARPGDLETSGPSPVADLMAEVPTATAPAALKDLPDSPSLFAVYLKQVAAKKAAASMADLSSRMEAPPPPRAAPGTMMNPVRDALLDEIAGRLKLARDARFGFAERLVLFWSNHFTVSASKQQVAVIAGGFEREAIRPHIAGRFHDMLEAVESHPAMLLYLDNERSMGEASKAGVRRGNGINENLAREILELHTVGVDAGYTQADVTSFAKALTGWTVAGAKAVDTVPGSFQFRPQMHEPGAQRVFGRDYPEGGQEQGQVILADLASHKATAQHIAFKLVRHFIADEPPKAAVAAVAAAFERSDGDLMAVYEALLKTDAAFAMPLTKLRPPVEFHLAALRALGAEAEPPRFMRTLALMGQRLYRAPSPQGWSDDSKAWLAPDAIRTRLELSVQLAGRTREPKPLDRAKAILGPLLTDETATMISRAESSQQALALLLMSPEFQRR